MKVTLNNNPEQLPGDELTIRQVLRIKNFTFPNLVVKINGQLVRKPQWEDAAIKEGDTVEIIHMISGG
ncbi:MAG: thiamine biosynthesis protein ThiS [Bacteroidetes bacterium GWF2_49_14]|nr:MAG: thiamine biosynthesis protein ThiS [Bacteroidetes bacterium GWF2_49_14]HBB91704.1 thiamine biosynthesis protein ThiS [Bacteroidales bacterium]